MKRLRIFWAVLGILLLSQLFIHRHALFNFEAWPEFHAVFGFVAFVFLVLGAKHVLRPLVKRDEDYYD